MSLSMNAWPADADVSTGPSWDSVKETIRTSLTMGQVIDFLGGEWDARRQKARCLWHNDLKPSLLVNEKTGWCFACKRSYDIFDYVQMKLGVGFVEAVGYLRERIAEVQNAYPSSIAYAGAPYRGAAPAELVAYWRSCLMPKHRQYLYGRLLNDHTIDSAGIGWRPDWRAYVIPYWRGKPGRSEIDIVQFRASADSPRFGGEEWRYVGLKGHNRASVINSHRVGRHSLVIFFGTFDSLLACQDGIASLSTNGATTFTRNPERLGYLTDLVSNTQHVYVVPDKQASEIPAAYQVAHILGAQVRHFPLDAAGKDYTEYRQAGKTPGDFLREVLMMDTPFLEDHNDERYVSDILDFMCNADVERALTVLMTLQTRYPAWSVLKVMKDKSCFDPYEGLTTDQWQEFRQLLDSCQTYADMAAVIKGGCQAANSNLGGF